MILSKWQTQTQIDGNGKYKLPIVCAAMFYVA